MKKWEMTIMNVMSCEVKGGEDIKCTQVESMQWIEHTDWNVGFP